MVIFHSYVSLPEGNMVLHKSVQYLLLPVPSPKQAQNTPQVRTPRRTPRVFRRNSGSPTFSCCRRTARPPCCDSRRSPATAWMSGILTVSTDIYSAYAITMTVQGPQGLIQCVYGYTLYVANDIYIHLICDVYILREIFA